MFKKKLKKTPETRKQEIKQYCVKTTSYHTNLYSVLELHYALKSEQQLIEKTAT